MFLSLAGKISLEMPTPLIFCCGLLGMTFLPFPSQDLEGTWIGSLKVGTQELRLALHLVRSQGGYSATLDSLDQGVTGIPCDRVSVEGGVLIFEINSLRIRFEGKINEKGEEITGTFKQGNVSLPLTLKRGEVPPPPRRPQTPQPPFPYAEEEVSFSNEDKSVTLGGTLTLPPGEGPFPAVVLISGSGLQDRDETIFGHKPFWVLADFLTRHGIAVLRVDDRGVGKSSGPVERATSRDFAEDVKMSWAYLGTRKEIDKKKRGLIGHSEGGLLAAMVASEVPEVAFIVMLAGSAVPGKDLLPLQVYRQYLASGVKEEVARKVKDLYQKFCEAVMAEPDKARVLEKIRAILKESSGGADEEFKKTLEMMEAQAEDLVTFLTGPWMRFFLAYDPAQALGKVRCPVLALNGSLDVQVDAGQNLSAIVRALEEGGNSDYTIVKVPGVNHLFQTAITGSPQEYGKIEETFSPKVMEFIKDWILSRFGKKEEPKSVLE
jgi:pimeloyl-ACP methyl ester carboxylesterase